MTRGGGEFPCPYRAFFWTLSSCRPPASSVWKRAIETYSRLSLEFILVTVPLLTFRCSFKQYGKLRWAFQGQDPGGACFCDLDCLSNRPQVASPEGGCHSSTRWLSMLNACVFLFATRLSLRRKLMKPGSWSQISCYMRNFF